MAAPAPKLERPSRLSAEDWALAALDVIATAAFLLATREGLLAVVAVITALYPAGTLLMARVVLGERMQLIQKVGLGLAGGSVVLLALAG